MIVQIRNIFNLIVASATKKRIRKEEEETKAECHVSFQKVTAALSCRVIKIMVPLIAKATQA